MWGTRLEQDYLCNRRLSAGRERKALNVATVTFLAFVVLIPTVAIWKGTRPNQLTRGGTQNTSAYTSGPVWTVLIPPLCAALSFTAFHLKGIGVCLVPQVSFGPHRASGSPNVLCQTLLWVGTVFPWFIGAGFAFLAVRRVRSRTIRIVGGIEFVLSMLFGWFWVVVTTGILYVG